ncbi:helix-turn-helix transcriptional regulator [Komagataeibacter medellinensis]|nr:helix-turn-helix transcriptional regulator [Komagataeibacter medellinensis]
MPIEVKQKVRPLTKGKISPIQSRSARAMLDWNQSRLAEKAGVSRMTVIDFEKEARVPHPNNLLAIQNAFEQAGIEFIDDNGRVPGVRLLRRWMIIQNAPEGFAKVGDPISIFTNEEYVMKLGAQTPQGVAPVNKSPEYGIYVQTYAAPGDNGTIIEVTRRPYSEPRSGHYDYVAFR